MCKRGDDFVVFVENTVLRLSITHGTEKKIKLKLHSDFRIFYSFLNINRPSIIILPAYK